METERGFISLSVLLAMLVVLSVIGGGAYFVVYKQTALQSQNIEGDLNGNTDTGDTPLLTAGTVPITSQATIPEKSTSSLKQLLSSHMNRKCTFDFSNPIGYPRTSGTAYTVAGMVRVDYEHTYLDGEGYMGGHLLIRDGMVYSWFSAQKGLGSKSSLEETAKAQELSGGNQLFDLNQQIQFSCSSWEKDGVTFSLPTDISFTDQTGFSESIIRNKTNPYPDSVTAQCELGCNRMSEPERSQCRMQLGCK